MPNHKDIAKLVIVMFFLWKSNGYKTINMINGKIISNVKNNITPKCLQSILMSIY